MFAYYTAARWFGITLDLVLGIFCAIVGLMELYTVKDSSTASMSFLIYFLCYNTEFSRNKYFRKIGTKKLFVYTEIGGMLLKTFVIFSAPIILKNFTPKNPRLSRSN